VSQRLCVCRNKLRGNRLFCDECVDDMEERIVDSGILDEIAGSVIDDDDVYSYAFRILRVAIRN
jgi:hypothetical protein